MNTDFLIEARLATSVAIVAAKEAPLEIQWMPPGRSKINASVNGKPGAVEVNVDASQAQRVAAELQQLRAKAAAGETDEPFFDYNHDDNGASARPTEFYWGGDDPKKGGIRAKLEWTASGKAAVEGKEYSRFSPTFAITKNGDIRLKGVNLGGLVNRAAFTNIAPILSRQSGGANDRNRNHMDEQTEKLVEAQAATIQKLTERLDKVEAKAAAVETEAKGLKEKLTTIEEAAKVQAKASAKAIVDAAVAAGKIPSQDTKEQEEWVSAIMVDAKMADRLQKLPSLIPAGRVTGARKTDGANNNATGEHDFVVKAKAMAAERKISEIDAQGALAAENPELYREYNLSLRAN